MGRIATESSPGQEPERFEKGESMAFLHVNFATDNTISVIMYLRSFEVSSRFYTGAGSERTNVCTATSRGTQ